MYAHSLSIDSMYEYKVHGPHGSDMASLGTSLVLSEIAS